MTGMPTATRTAAEAGYDGRAPFSRPATPARAGIVPVTLTSAIVIAPFLTLGAGIWLAWGSGITLTDLLLAAVFYVVTGLGVTVGFHRLLTHRSFTARPWLRVVLAVAGSMSFQGNLIDWVAAHRRHRAFTDRPGDPHSPYRYGTGLGGQLRGLAHARLGWLFSSEPTSGNGHHSQPGCTRHGRGPRQIDPSAALIGLFEPPTSSATHAWWPASTHCAPAPAPARSGDVSPAQHAWKELVPHGGDDLL